MLAYQYVHPPSTGDASKPTRNGSFILMEVLLTTLLTCEYATGLVDQIYRQHTETPKSELVQIVAQSTEPGCFEDAKAD